MCLDAIPARFGWQSALLGFLAVVMLCCLTACGGKKLDQIILMPAPDIYDAGTIDPFNQTHPQEKITYEGILYATDRKRAEDGDEQNTYLNERGFLLRLGIGRIELGDNTMTWEEAREISLLKNRPEKYPLKVTRVEEIGVLAESYSNFIQPKESDIDEPGNIFAAMINEKLAKSERRDIYIYVHGYKVIFENPLLVATELWHFLGYDGVFIAFAWPSTPKKLAYFSDLETTSLSSYNLRILIEYLAKETNAENIHIIGYSAGTRLVINALYQLALMYREADKAALKKRLRISHVILAGSDFDRQLFAAYLDEGILKVSKDFIIYLSEMDKALSLSRWLFKQNRLGQMWDENKMTDDIIGWLWKTEDLIFIDVSDAEKSNTGNGHAYFRQSPWVSSDILSTLMYDLTPAERGLYRTREWPMWKFPTDYISRLSDKLIERNPVLAPLKDQQTK